MSQQMAIQMGGTVLSVALQNKSQQAQNIFLQSYGIGSQLGVLKYSRTHETEADKMGLVFAAMAGYDPNAAIGFWERMAAASGGQKPPELLSTHPSDEKRINDLKAFMPEAMKYFKKSE
jgi:predicted Zn-dependent protease